MRKLFLLVVLVIPFIMVPEGVFSQLQQLQQDPNLILKEFSEHYHHGDGRITFSSRLGDQNTWDGSEYQYYIWNDIEKRIQFASNKLYFFDWYTRLDDLDSSVLIDDMRWQVQYWRAQGGGEWRTLDLYNHQWFDPIIYTKNITFIQGYDDTINFMNVSYVVTNQAQCKVNIDYVSGEEREIRFIWQLSGMSGQIQPNMMRREFIFDNMIISCNDTDPSVGFDYEWLTSTKKLDVKLGSFNVAVNDWVFIDPTFAEKQETDAQDFYMTYDRSTTYTAEIGVDLDYAGDADSSTEAKSYIAYDTGITDNIASTSDASMSYYVYAENVESEEYHAFYLYDSGDVDEIWDETEADGDEQGCYDQETYWSDVAFFCFNGYTSSNATIDDTKVGPLVDEWVSHHNGDVSGRQYISIMFWNGTGMDNGEYIIWYESSEGTANKRPTLTFTYTIGAGENTAPETVVHTALSGTLYAGKNFTFVCNYTDSDGQADLAWLLSGLGEDQYDITLNITASSGRQTAVQENGSSYVNVADGVCSSITNGWQVTWTVNLTFSWTDFDDSNTIDTWCQAWDDEPESSSWATDDSNVDYENDLEIVTFNVLITNSYATYPNDDWINDTDWFKGGVQVTINGTVEYEGSSEVFESIYANEVDVELYYDSGATGEKDTSISSGVFEGITYTPTSGSNDIDTTAYFDGVINDIPTGGSDVTGAGIEITSKRDNEDPTTTFHSITENDPHIYIYASGQIVYFSDLMGSTDQLCTIGVNVSDSSGSGVYSVTMSAWDDDAEWNDTSSPYQRQYSTDDTETSGSITLYAIDNVGNSDSTPVTITMTEDTTAPTGSVAHDADSASVGFAPINISYDDDDTLDFTASGANDASAGLPTNCYSWNGSAWTSDTTKQYTSQPDGNITLTLYIRDNVGNNYSISTWVIIDTDSPTGFTVTWTRVNGTYPIQIFDGNLTIYFDPGNNCNNYTTLTINDDGSIQNSLFWRILWDENSVFESAENDTSGLPDSKNFYYRGDTNGSFYVYVVNNAGNYQLINYTAYDTLDGGCGEPPTTTTSAPTDREPPQAHPYNFYHPYLINMLTPIPLLGTLAIGLAILIFLIRRTYSR